MKLAAYILAADPAWLEESVLSYYDSVESIVVSYDSEGKGWTGAPIAVFECLDRLKAIDRANKMVFCPGHFARLDHAPMENETYQRACAIEVAEQAHPDWVLQLDTDEVIADMGVFLDSLTRAGAAGASALEFPLRWLYKQLGPQSFLELRDKFWRRVPRYPGPVALRPGTRLRMARQCEGKYFRVGFGPFVFGHHWPIGHVDQLVRPEEGILHFSWVRDEPLMRAKLASWGHAKDRDWSEEYHRWEWAGRHPYLAILSGPFARGREWRYLAIHRIRQALHSAPASESPAKGSIATALEPLRG